jgi:uncharacterized protein involved in response to NO
MSVATSPCMHSLPMAHALRASRGTERRVALFELGFRPLFLLAAAFGVVAVPLWLVALRGGLRPGGPFGALQWHAHEMLFGFTAAIVAGFLLTATGNWTGRPTLKGLPLAALAALWVAGRVAVFFAAWAPRTAAVLDVAFLPLVALACAVPLFAAKNKHNYVFLAILGVLSACNAGAHRAAIAGDGVTVQRLHALALDVYVLVIATVTGRIVPMFTRNATAVAGVERSAVLERATLGFVLVQTLADALQVTPLIHAPLSLCTALVLAARMRRWGTWSSRNNPLLWILHLGSAWLAVGFVLRALADVTAVIPASSALHALTAGAIGSLTLGMMARASLGHTGRMLRASRLTVAAFYAVAGAGALRVAAPLLPSALYLPLLDTAGLAWSTAFALFVVSHGRMLVTPRVDGR